MNVLLSSTTEIHLLTVLETGKLKSKDPQGLFSFEDSLSGLQTVTFTSDRKEREERRECKLVSLFIRVTNLIMRAPIS